MSKFVISCELLCGIRCSWISNIWFEFARIKSNLILVGIEIPDNFGLLKRFQDSKFQDAKFHSVPYEEITIQITYAEH